LKGSGIDGRIILKWIFQEYNKGMDWSGIVMAQSPKLSLEKLRM